MADTLLTIAEIANEPMFNQRLNAGAAQQGVPGEPTAWVANNRYLIAAAPSWAEAVDYWKNTNPEGGAGWAIDPAVITDTQIIGQIQAMLAAE